VQSAEGNIWAQEGGDRILLGW